ncbi:hypothetical protein C7974DRAFT_216154 [Boeremia exigua]|uniref:uncharacterized protein n=1 Tax=Boeremia exigua TaxID=749465 RepID=UPI001E8DB52F|nr:uncharacterized protein C7974DRAFT_216154 [Boeremia exigua]KAH6622099.1 hypothetical protein C7974DRAFT_216154 [Boeremia exigua]
MARRIVKVMFGGQAASLLVVLSSSQLCSALADTVRTRLPTIASKLGLATTDGLHISLHLESETGPMLDPEDLLCDVLLDTKETICAVIVQAQVNSGVSRTQPQPHIGSDDQLRLRVVTPELAHEHHNVDTIVPTAQILPLSTTLLGLRAAVCQHLNVPTGDEALQELDCNCSAAQQIDSNAALNECSAENSDALHTLVVVYEDNKVTVVPIEEPTLASIQRAARVQLQDKATGKLLCALGGVAARNAQAGDSGRYLKLPVLAVCSHQSHRHHEEDDGAESVAAMDNRGLTLDLHISECPIDITIHNKDVTIEAAGLHDCAVDGVLTIFAVQRVFPTNNNHKSGSAKIGKAAIFQRQHAWEHPLGQSERGLANLLSTLRKFTDITSGSNMKEPQQDAVLRILHLMTRFPPAVRTAYVLMRGETPQPSECAALSQCLYEILKDVVPLATVHNNPQRLFEGSRLLFGLILGRAKTLRVSSSSSENSLPYTSMQVHDLRSAVTMRPVRGPAVQSKIGLIDVGLYDAFAENGVITWINDNNTGMATSVDQKLARVVTLAGGMKTKVVTFNPDTVALTTRYLEKGINTVVAQTEISNLQYLASMCSNNHLSVIPPADLPSASPPVLTLDRQGFLSVYVGREGCGQPGRDILMFRPLTGEEAIDVSVITQLLVPVLAHRNVDGTAVFEAYGSHDRYTKDPEEAVVVCVDLSSSMGSRCGFVDIEESEDADASVNRAIHTATPATTSLQVEHPGSERLALDELKEYILAHDSFEDMLVIVRAGTEYSHRRQNASQVLKILGQLHQQQITENTKELEVLRRRATHSYNRALAASSERDLFTLSNRLLRMERFADPLCAFLTYRAENAGSLPGLEVWRPGASAPVATPQQSNAHNGPFFELPTELICPISNELMEDPVMTVDGFTYERKNIERWLHTKRTSPLTNIELSSTDLRSDARSRQEVDAYLKGKDIFVAKPAANMQTVSIKSPLGSYTMELPHSLTLIDLYALAFRLTKGRYPRFELHHRNASLPFAPRSLETSVAPATDVFVAPLETTTLPSFDTPGDMYLVKVYSWNNRSTPVCSYWEPRSATKTLESVVFRYYRHMFSKNAYALVEHPFTIWHGMRDVGDGYCTASCIAHWKAVSELLNLSNATGSVNAESAYDNSDSPTDLRTYSTTGPLVLKLALGPSPAPPAGQRKTLSRLEVLKQMFDAFINRLLAYNFRTHVGLVTFSSTVSVSQDITHAIEDFRHQLNNMIPRGDTAIWDSVALAMDRLQQYALKYPKARLRIICISDGEDNKSSRLVHDLASQLVSRNIVVDSFCLGNENNTDLQTLSYVTGGYKFEPSSLEEAMAICEMEPVLSLADRPVAVLPRISSRHAGNALYRFQKAKQSISVDHATRDEFPQRKVHPQLAGSFVELKSFARHAPQARSDGNLRLSRIHSEIRTCGALVHPHYDIYICEENFGFWKIAMQGPPESTYAGGTFLLYVEMGADYPLSPPQARFVTSVYHPNINRHGRICHSILDRNWTVDTTTKDVIDTIYSLLLVPEFSDPINIVVTLNYHWDEVQFKEEAQRDISKYATKTRAEWRAEITG